MFYVKRKYGININKEFMPTAADTTGLDEKKYKVVDLFAGAGGLSLGFLQTQKYDIKAAVQKADTKAFWWGLFPKQ